MVENWESELELVQCIHWIFFSCRKCGCCFCCRRNNTDNSHPTTIPTHMYNSLSTKKKNVFLIIGSVNSDTTTFYNYNRNKNHIVWWRLYLLLLIVFSIATSYSCLSPTLIRIRSIASIVIVWLEEFVSYYGAKIWQKSLITWRLR